MLPCPNDAMCINAMPEWALMPYCSYCNGQDTEKNASATQHDGPRPGMPFNGPPLIVHMETSSLQ